MALMRVSSSIWCVEGSNGTLMSTLRKTLLSLVSISSRVRKSYFSGEDPLADVKAGFGVLFNDLSGMLLAAEVRRLFCRGGSAWSDPERGTTAPDSYLQRERSGSRGFENSDVRDSRPRHFRPFGSAEHQKNVFFLH